MNRLILVAVGLGLLIANAIAIYRAVSSHDVPTELSAVTTARAGVETLPAHPVAAGELKLRDPPWTVVQKTKVSTVFQDSKIDYDPEFVSYDGTPVRISGVLFFVKEGLENGQVKWCVLMPPARFSCCGVSCDPRQELMFFVDCSKHLWPRPETKIMATVEGRLRLRHDDSSWCLYTLEDARVTPMAGSKP